MAEQKELINEAVRQIGLKLVELKPHLFTIDKIITDEMLNDQSGIIDFSVRVYNGKVTDVVVTKTTRYVIKK